jgi:hypothetical protein
MAAKKPPKEGAVNPAPDDIRKAFGEWMEANPPEAAISLDEFEALPQAEQIAHQQQGKARFQARLTNGIAAVARAQGTSVELVRSVIDPAPVASHWTVLPSTPDSIRARANVMLEANPKRAGADYWRRAAAFANLTSKAIEAGDAEGAAHAAMGMIRQAIHAELLEGPIPQLRRDAARQAGTRKPRGSRKPLLDAWLDKRLEANPAASSEALWNALKGADQDGDLYVDGESLIEVNEVGREAVIKRAGFDARLTAARKRRK